MQRDARRAAFDQRAYQCVDLLGRTLHDAPPGRIAIVGMAHHQRREGRVVGGRRLVHPGDGLDRVVLEARHHLRPAALSVDAAPS